MKIRNLINTTTLAAVALLAASCANEYLSEGNNVQSLTGEEVAISFSYSVQGMSAGDGTETLDPVTYTVPDDLGAIDGAGLSIENMFVIQFNGNTPSSTMIGAARFLDASDLASRPLSVPLIQISDPCYTLFVANIPEGNNYNWNMSTQSTFADVVTRIKTMASESDAYVTVNSTKTLLVSAVVDSPVQLGTTLAPSFTRDVAKLTLKLTLDNADMQIKSVRLRNVSTGIVYADAALNKTGVNGATVYPVGATTIDYDAITVDMPTYGGGAKSFSWYVPRNQRGVNTSSTAAIYKTFYAPDCATYFEIVAVKTGGSATSTSVFRVYPGADEIKDFNITANYRYTINLTVKDIGDSSMDSRVETFDNVSYVDNGGWGSKSNSFIINPAPAGGGIRYYDIPIDQVNRYWSGSADGYGNTSANTIGSAEKWTISLIWSDLTGLFSQTYTTTSGICLENNNGSGYGIGQGPDEFFRLLVPAGVPEGNFTLGIKKDNGEYLWSWHFWVTGYNPNTFNKSVISDGVYTYPVPGGQVERYIDNGTTALWGTGKAYEKSVMMDRALGMLSENYKAQPTTSSRGILHYQFGRKDPFPVVRQEGLSVGINSTDAPILIKKSMAVPATFFATDASPYTWTSEASSTSYTWCDPNGGTDKDKSIYDPCPPGWRMPVNGTWSDFSHAVDGTYINTQNTLRGLGYNYGRGFGSVSSNVNGLRYWPGTTATAQVDGTIWYPATGYRGRSNGTLTTVGSYGYYWSSSPTGTSGYYLTFASTYVIPSNNGNRANGFSVRCVAEK